MQNYVKYLNWQKRVTFGDRNQSHRSVENRLRELLYIGFYNIVKDD